MINPSYVFATPVLGGQLAVGMMGIVGHNNSSLDGTITGGVGPFFSDPAGSFDSSLTGLGDLVSAGFASLEQGVHNFMTYVTGDIPVGAYNPSAWPILASDTARSMAALATPTSTRKPATNFRRSAASPTISRIRIPNIEMVSTSISMGHFRNSYPSSCSLALSATPISKSRRTAALADFGPFKSRVSGMGPQIGYLFPVGNMQGYLNLKGYKEFEASNRPDGWNVWLSAETMPAGSLIIANIPLPPADYGSSGARLQTSISRGRNQWPPS